MKKNFTVYFNAHGSVFPYNVTARNEKRARAKAEDFFLFCGVNYSIVRVCEA